MAGIVLLTCGVLVAPLGANAAPAPQNPVPATKQIAAPTTSAQALANLASLATDNEKLSEQFNQAQIDLVNDQKAAAAAAVTATKAGAALVLARRELASVLVAQYKGSTFSRTAALLASDSGQNYLEKMQSLKFVALHQQDVARLAVAATATATAAQADATNAVAAAVTKKASLASQRTALASDIGRQKTLLASLSAKERAAYLAVTAAPKAAVVKLQSAPVAAKSKGAAVAIQAAMAELGKPYSWGSAGPDSFDCSGLTMWAWAHAGVTLPHQSAEQQSMGVSIPQNQLQPGDLVFFGSPAYHVGIYIGNGMMIHAPTTGDVVKISPITIGGYSGAVRVG
ncbi:MAG: putative Cell wall-associated hydrolase [Frankiales bacterium]|nr:putative Cell wall-associated hydrolase [Frankiales bacterium]